MVVESLAAWSGSTGRFATIRRAHAPKVEKNGRIVAHSGFSTPFCGRHGRTVVTCTGNDRLPSAALATSRRHAALSGAPRSLSHV
jgi:hypothetical protein